MSLLVDVNNIIKPRKLLLLEQKVGPFPITDDATGVVLIIGEDMLAKLKSKNKGDERINYMNTLDFLQSIYDFGYISFNIKNKVCNIPVESIRCLEEIIKNTMRYLPNDFTLCCKVLIHDTILISTLIDNGFVGSEIKNSYIEMSRINSVFIDSSVREETIISTPVTNSSHCKYRARLSDEAIKYLRRIPERGVTIRNGVFSQKEIAGSLVTGVIDDSMVHYLDIGQNQNYGDDQNVHTVPSMITFHTHPVEAYERNNVTVGWPSSTDYISFMKVGEQVNLIMHIVVALEGFYVISRNKEWFESRRIFDDKAEAIVRSSMAFEKLPSRTGNWHVNQINRITVDELHIIKVFFVPWSKPKTIFEVFYNTDDDQCKIPKNK
jgi:hypothetical protein